MVSHCLPSSFYRQISVPLQETHTASLIIRREGYFTLRSLTQRVFVQLLSVKSLKEETYEGGNVYFFETS